MSDKYFEIPDKFFLIKTFRSWLHGDTKPMLCHARGWVDDRLVYRWWSRRKQVWRYEVQHPESLAYDIKYGLVVDVGYEPGEVLNFRVFLERHGVDPALFWKNMAEENRGWSWGSDVVPGPPRGWYFQELPSEDWVNHAFDHDRALQPGVNWAHIDRCWRYTLSYTLENDPEAVVKSGFDEYKEEK